MYEIDDENMADSHYGVDQLGGGARQVLIVQDADMENMTAEELGGFLEKASDDVEQIEQVSAMVSEAIRSAKQEDMVKSLSKARALRRALSKRYGTQGSRLAIVESAAVNTASVFALEEESEEQVGFLRRILRSIANAFKWLWEKIFGTSSSDKKKNEDTEEKLDSAEKKVAEEKTAGSPEPTTPGRTVDLKGVPESVLYWLEARRTPSGIGSGMAQIEAVLKSAIAGTSQLKDLTRYLKDALAAITSGTGEEGIKVFMMFNQKVEKMVSSWPTINEADVKDDISDLKANFKIHQLRGFTNLPSGRGYVAVSLSEEGGMPFWKTFPLKSKVEKKEAKFSRASMKEGSDFVIQATGLLKLVRELSDETAQIVELDRTVTSALDAIIERDFSSTEDHTRAAQNLIRSVIQPLTKVIGNLAIFYATVPQEGRLVTNFVIQYCNVCVDDRKAEMAILDKKD